MTRINCVPPEELADKHLFAEWRGMPRLVKNLKKSLNRKSGKPFSESEIPDKYLLGKDHVKFFYNKFKWLHERHQHITQLLLQKGYNLSHTDSEVFGQVPRQYYNDWTPTLECLKINRERISERLRER